MNMKELRECRGLSTVEIAYRLGRAESTIRNWDSGREIPRLGITEIPTLLEIYQCSLEELVAAARESKARFESRNAA